MARNLALGKGELHFAPFASGTQVAGGYRFLGNCPEFTLTIDDEQLDHYSSTSGVREKDDQVTLEVSRSGSITCDDVQAKNLALFFLGTAATLSVAGATDVTETISSVEQGLQYQLGVSTSAPSGARKVTSVVVTDGEESPTTYDVTDDYTVDADLGLITIVEGGAITDASDIEVTYDVTAHSRDQVISQTTAIEGSLKFISKNPKGTKFDYHLPWVRFMPNGDISLIQDQEWMTIPLNIEAFKLDTQEAIYLDGRPVTA
jgi:hypothetical protein